jgi:hypothetical protein
MASCAPVLGRCLAIIERSATVKPAIDLFRPVTWVLVLTICIAGCTHLVPSVRQPDRLYSIDDEIAWVRYDLGTQNGLLSAYWASPNTTTRNAVITERMYAIDVLYTKYESQLTHENQDVNFGATAVELGLTTAATLVPVAQTTRLLSGIATGVNGLDTAYNEKILLSKTIQNVQTQMRANRSEQAAIILANMKCDLNDYPLGLAMSDLESYYRAGTFTAGLIKLSDTVSKAEGDAQQKKEAQTAAESIAAAAVAKAASELNAKVAELTATPAWCRSSREGWQSERACHGFRAGA